MADLERFWRKTPLGPLGVKHNIFFAYNQAKPMSNISQESLEHNISSNYIQAQLYIIALEMHLEHNILSKCIQVFPMHNNLTRLGQNI
jgi:hypothetical protein